MGTVRTTASHACGVDWELWIQKVWHRQSAGQESYHCRSEPRLWSSSKAHILLGLFFPTVSLGSTWQHVGVKGGTASSPDPLLSKMWLWTQSSSHSSSEHHRAEQVEEASEEACLFPKWRDRVSEGGAPFPRPTGHVLQSKDTSLGPLWLLVWPDTGKP